MGVPCGTPFVVLSLLYLLKEIPNAVFLSEEEPEDKLKYTYNGYYEDNKSYDEEQSKSMHNWYLLSLCMVEQKPFRFCC